ncbi:hypothetical protein [Mycobacterium interjectum]|uniref:hypothetical protein n=1 Tax=Mycobacterium interjectum TaxID=33895 RepID=UPI0011558C4B|nr:hypothetical protein [Mycobacterium interjectum]
MLVPSEVVSYLDMCREEGVNLQRGMNFGSSGKPSIILMSRRPGAPYDDRVEEDRRVLNSRKHPIDVCAPQFGEARQDPVIADQ